MTAGSISRPASPPPNLARCRSRYTACGSKATRSWSDRRAERAGETRADGRATGLDMGLIKGLRKFRGGWPGGWRRYALGTPRRDPRPFVQPRDPDDRRSLIPPLGFREYWYPALPARAIKWRKPVGLRICGIDIVLFRDHGGEVRALSNICPHRGAWLSWGDCFWKGFISCPYHGATFDGDGN